MKKLTNLAVLLFAVLGAGIAAAQISDITSPGTIILTSTCTNLHTTCDTAGVTNFIINSPFSVQGPQTIEVGTQGYGLATVSATGTYTGSTLNFEFSDDGGNTWYSNICTRTDLNTQESSEALASNATLAWDCGVGAATKFRVRQSALGTGGPSVRVTLTAGLVEPAPTIQINNTVGTGDPCLNPGVQKSSAFADIATATTTSLSSISGTTQTYVCGFALTMTGTTAADTAQFVSGTGPTCGTATVNLSSTFNSGILTSGATVISFGGSGSVFKPTNAATHVCVTTTVGSSPNINVTITYVQQ